MRFWGEVYEKGGGEPARKRGGYLKPGRNGVRRERELEVFGGTSPRLKPRMRLRRKGAKPCLWGLEKGG